MSFQFNNAFYDEADPDIRRYLNRVVDAVAADARGNAEVDTGEMASSISGHVEGFGRNLEGVVEASSDHAYFVEVGTEDTEPEPFLRPALFTGVTRVT